MRETIGSMNRLVDLAGLGRNNRADAPAPGTALVTTKSVAASQSTQPGPVSSSGFRGRLLNITV